MSGAGSAGPAPPLALGRGLAAVLCAAWTVLVWELLADARVRIEPWTWWMPYLFDASHAALFGVEALLLERAWRGRGTPGPGRPSRPGPTWPGPTWLGPTWLGPALLACAYGVAIEWRQGTLPGRDASLGDVLTNALGAFGVPWALAARPGWWRRLAGVGALALACAIAVRLLR